MEDTAGCETPFPWTKAWRKLKLERLQRDKRLKKYPYYLPGYDIEIDP